MKFLSRVVWSEGMHLSPQHFQMQSRYFEDSLWFLNGNLRNHPWGLLSLSLDADAVRNGLAVLRYASGIFPDGLVFELPDSDPAPPPLSLRDLFAPTDSEILLYLAVPARGDKGSDTDLSSAGPGSGSRFSLFERVLKDETISEDEYAVSLGRKNFVLCSGAQLKPDSVSFPIARIRRDGKGSFVPDPGFLPPMLRIGVVEDLLHRMKRLADSVEEKITVTRQGKRAATGMEVGINPLQVREHWFLHALCSALPALRHQLETRNSHPEELFAVLSELGGSLCTFVMESTPATLPYYDHLELNRVFGDLEAHIQRHLELIIPTNTITLQFTPAQDAQYVHYAPIKDERALRRSVWIFGIRSDIAASAAMRLTPNLVKLCSAQGVGSLLKRALPGLELVHMPTPPAVIDPQVDTQYFGIGMAGPCWEHILATKQVGIYVPGELGKAAFEITIITEATS